MILQTASVRAGAPTHAWSRPFGDYTLHQYGRSAAVDASGNVYVVGSFEGSFWFYPDLPNPITSNGAADILLMKFNAAGVAQWYKGFGDTLVDEAVSVALDASGNVVVTGNFRGTVNFGGGALVSAGLKDIFVAKFDPAGVHQWSQRFGDASDQSATSVAVDASGNVIICGAFTGTVNFGGGVLTSAGSTDIFVAKFNAMGAHQWSRRFGGVLSQLGNSVAVDASGNVTVCGYFADTVDFGGGTFISAGNIDAFVAKFSASGVHQWSRSFGDPNWQDATAVAVDASGAVLVTGDFYGGVNFGGGTLTSAGSDDIFLAKYDAAGTHLWSRRFGDAGFQGTSVVAVDVSGNVFITGAFESSVDFGGGVLTSAGGEDIFLAKFNPAGVYRWSDSYGGTYDHHAYSVAVGAIGDVVLTGYYQDPVDFGGGPLNSAPPYGDEGFVVSFTPGPEPTIVDVTDVGNDQGRQAKIRFERSGVDDADSSSPVEHYEAYLRSDPLPSTAAFRASATNPGPELAPGWLFVGAVPAHAEGAYEIYVPTQADSTVAAGQHYSIYFIRAATASPYAFYDSPRDSGYSLDNLSPNAPAMFAFNAGELTWEESSEADFGHFSVYGSNGSDFGSAVFIGDTPDTRMDVTASPYGYYFVTAIDLSGNESGPAVTDGPTGVDETPKSYSLSVSAYPNPFNPSTTIRYTLPSKGHVTIAVYNARGTLVTTLVGEERPAGAHAVSWDGRTDERSTASSGIYFARVEFGNEVRAYKLVLLK